jgi:hypothetical protein
MQTESVFQNSRYSPARGGHAPNDLRDAFIECVEARGAPVDFQDRRVTLDHLCGYLWNCSDTLPGYVCDLVTDLVGEDVSRGYTFASAARALRRAAVAA